MTMTATTTKTNHIIRHRQYGGVTMIMSGMPTGDYSSSYTTNNTRVMNGNPRTTATTCRSDHSVSSTITNHQQRRHAHYQQQKYQPEQQPDYYKLLRILPNATIEEIKLSYRTIVKELHPDRNQGCSQKTEQLKQVNIAYDILLNQRTEYDKLYHKANKPYNSRTDPLSPNYYRKVYTTRPPPNWTMTWDHVKHYDMHYGDGFQKEAIKMARKEQERNQAQNSYQSPLGKGFTFSTFENSDHHHNDDDDNQLNYNPYSKYSPQGPPQFIIEYEEGEISDTTKGKYQMNRRHVIMEDLYQQRQHRRQQSQHQQHQQQQRQSHYVHMQPPRSFRSKYDDYHDIQTKNHTTSHNKNHDCVIL